MRGIRCFQFVISLLPLNACRNFDWPPESPAVAGSVSGSLPDVPQFVLATSSSARNELSWQAVAGATGYVVYFAATAGVTKGTATAISTNSNPYTHTGLTNNTTYYYAIAAVNGAGESALSAEVSSMPAAVRKIFVSSGSYTGNMAGIAGANATCQSHATAAGLTGRFNAYISTQLTDAACNILGLTGKKAANCGLPNAPTFDTLVPVQNTQAQAIQTSLFTLINSDGGAVNCGAGNAICTGVGYNELGSSASTTVRSITTTGGVFATDPPGNTACANLTLGTNDGIGVLYGTSYDINNWWYSAGWSDNCASAMRIYCIQQ